MTNLAAAYPNLALYTKLLHLKNFILSFSTIKGVKNNKTTETHYNICTPLNLNE